MLKNPYTVRRVHGNLITIWIAYLVAHFPHRSYNNMEGKIQLLTFHKTLL
jgi:hypothetical protein